MKMLDSKSMVNGLLNFFLITLLTPLSGLLILFFGIILKPFFPMTDAINWYAVMIPYSLSLTVIIFIIRFIIQKRVKDKLVATWTLLPVATVALCSYLAWFVLSSRDDMSAVLPASSAFLMTVYMVTIFVFTGKFFIKTKNTKKA
ncbi:MAG: hypothetical protein Q7S53_03770 [bacterium]|nr:hypothetical protein [bacterium]